MREIMRRAHQLAKEMEGHYHARMALALRMAWAEARRPKKAVLKVAYYARAPRGWVARLIGRDQKYRFAREFLDPVARERSGSGRTGADIYELGDGIYEVNEPYRGRSYCEVRAGKITWIYRVEDVLARIA